MAFVQSLGTSTNGTVGLTLAQAFGSNVAAGNLIVALVTRSTADASSSTCGDSLGNTYTSIISKADVSNGQHAELFYVPNIVGGACTVTAYFNVAAGFRGLIATEYSGLRSAAAADSSASNVQPTPGTGTDGVTVGPVTPSLNGETVVAAAVDTGAVGTNPFTAGTNFSLRSTMSGTGLVCGAMEDLVQGTAASISGTFTSSRNEATLSLLATLKAAALSSPLFRGS